MGRSRLPFPLLLLSLWAFPAWACRCLQPDTPEKGIDSSEAVFTGRVLSLKGGAGAGRFNVEVELEVMVGWKGVRGQRLTLRTGRGKGDCGYPFQVGKRYLVFAFGKDDLKTDICTRTTELGGAEKDLKALQKRSVLVDRRGPERANLFSEFHRVELGEILQQFLAEPRLSAHLPEPLILRRNRQVRDAPRIRVGNREIVYEESPRKPHLELTSLDFGKSTADLAFRVVPGKVSGKARLEKQATGWRLIHFELEVP